MRQVEVSAVVWRTSSYSNQQGGECVEVAVGEARTAVRDSKNAAGGVLTVPASGWSALMNTLIC